MRPRLLDAFCCEGGAAVGYHRAGFDVVGVDLVDKRKRYPFEFHRGDAIDFIRQHGHEFDAIHASPPCQHYSITKHTHSNTHPDLVESTRVALIASGRPWVMENVVGAPMPGALILCGTEFRLETIDVDGIRLYLKRHRLFESNVLLMGAGGCRCVAMRRAGVQCAGVYGGGNNDKSRARNVRHGGYTPNKAVAERLLGIDWMTMDGLSQSIPPAYTEWIGMQLMAFTSPAPSLLTVAEL